MISDRRVKIHSTVGPVYPWMQPQLVDSAHPERDNTVAALCCFVQGIGAPVDSLSAGSLRTNSLWILRDDFGI